MTQFTGSSEVAEHLAQLTRGKIKIEDAGFDWCILGPDFDPKYLDYVAWQRDQDTFAASGQKCSATSILFMHRNWAEAGLVEKLAELAGRRNLSELTIGPVITWTTERILTHVQRLMAIPGARLLFGGKPLTGHSIPECYGAIEPTAVFVPLDQMMTNKYFELVTTEVFGPVYVITEYDDGTLPDLLHACERMKNHLTAAVVSNDPVFVNQVLGATVNGTTYVGIRARSTGAPQNHQFAPGGDPRAANIGTPEAIVDTWSFSRCVVVDVGPTDFTAALVQS